MKLERLGILPNLTKKEIVELVNSVVDSIPEEIELFALKEAEKFMNFGEIKLNKGDLIVFYSDGFAFTVSHKKFFKTIYQETESLTDQLFIPYTLLLAKQNPPKFGKERTLIAIIY